MSAPDEASTEEADPTESEEQLLRRASDAAFDFLIKQGLYAKLDVTTELGALTEEKIRLDSTFGFDAYCVGCRRETTFRISKKSLPTHGLGGSYSRQADSPALFAVFATCQRDWTVYTYVIMDDDKALTKIGQFPSSADVAFGELRSIDKTLDQVDRRELGKALGLFSHDSAIGAFVYLRRVFERMIDRAHVRQSEAGRPVTDFTALPMDQRIAALKEELPDTVVRNSGVFSVLSLGLHELTEEQCTKHFPVMKAVLFQMLEQEEHKRKAALTQKETDGALQRILSDPSA